MTPGSSDKEELARLHIRSRLHPAQVDSACELARAELDLMDSRILSLTYQHDHLTTKDVEHAHSHLRGRWQLVLDGRARVEVEQLFLL